MSTREYSGFTLYRRLLLQARPYWRHILGLLLLSLLATPLALLVPLPIKIAVDSILGDRPLPGFVASVLPEAWSSGMALLTVVAVLIVAIAVLRNIRKLAYTLLNVYTSQRLVLDFQGRLFRHMQQLSLVYHDAKGSADSLYRIQSDAKTISKIAIDGINPFVSAAFTLGSMIYIIVLLDWKLAVVALLVCPVLVAIIVSYRKRLRKGWRALKHLESSAWHVVHEVLGALRVVKAFGQEEREHGRFVRQSEKSVRARLRVQIAQGNYSLFVETVIAIGTAAVVVIGVRHVLSNTLTLGDLLVVISYLGQLYSPLSAIGSKLTNLQESFASAERAFSLLDESPKVVERPGARPLVRASGDFELRDVGFSYDVGHPVLAHVSVEIPAGTRVGIAGKTGAGKTTLVNLLARFFDPTNGQILLDGVDIRDYKLADLHNQFAIVLQDTILFSTTVSDNIAYARPSASVQDIVEAARAADAHNFIMQLPDQYDTLVGERGMRLSGGERQRVALARAFLKDAPILILDEPTSAVDNETESSIMQAMDRLMRNRTTFMIAHRLTTLQDCELLLVIDDGKVTATSSDVSDIVWDSLALDELRIPS